MALTERVTPLPFVFTDVFEDERTNETRAEDDEEGDGHDQVPGVKQKWKLLPHFLKLRGLMRQHIDSYDYFVNVDISKVNSPGMYRSIMSPAFFFFLLERVGLSQYILPQLVG